MTAEASSRWAARKAGPISVEKTLAWKAKGRELAISMASSRVVEAVDACHGAEDLQLRHLGVGRRVQKDRGDKRGLGPAPAADQLRTARHRLVYPAAHAGRLSGEDEGTDLGVGQKRVPTRSACTRAASRSTNSALISLWTKMRCVETQTWPA